MLLALEVDHGHRQRVRQLATRRGEGRRDQDDRPTPGEWGGKDAGADVQRVDKIDTARHHPPQGQRHPATIFVGFNGLVSFSEPLKPISTFETEVWFQRFQARISTEVSKNLKPVNGFETIETGLPVSMLTPVSKVQ